jgi:Asp-tRNA(Asn)/Glu-tRNA(Gln) amidotransferase A subunit family amidase
VGAAADAGGLTAASIHSAAELGALFARGELSPVEALEAVLDRIERFEPALCALWSFEPERARAAAQASEARWQRGQPLSPLDGTPVTLKENIATAGVAMPLGCAATTLSPATADAPPAARLAEAGCVLLAKTTMPDWGMLTSGLSSFHKLARNPWDLARTPGGSSAGAAAACAAGIGALHLGTDIGGSIRLPANWCGVVGFKPSGGRVPIQPPYIGRVAGPLARSVEDCALAMSVLAQPDARDTMALPHRALDWHAAVALPAEGPRGVCTGLRVGLWLDPGWGLAPEAAPLAAARSAARALEREGAVVHEVPAFMTRAMADGLNDFWRTRAWVDMQALAPDARRRVLPCIAAWAEAGGSFGGEHVFRAFSQIGATREAAVAACAPFDVVVSPVCPVGAPPAEWASPTNDPLRAMEHIAYTVPFNMSEQPALALPWMLDDTGMPVGVQIAGPRHGDLAVLRVAKVLEALRGALPEPPLR